MIKLGDAYFDEASILAISPCIAPGADGPASHYTVHLAGGQFYRWTADAEEVQRRLEEVGLIDPQPLPTPGFTESERVELSTCLALGYGYAAKDENGRIFAYESAPAKGERSWLNDDRWSHVTPLVAGEYAALSFEDEHPLDIAVALEGMSE